MRVGVVARLDLPSALEVVRKLLRAVPRDSLVLEERLAQKLGEEGRRVEEMEAEALLTVGGDGTLLGAHLLAPHLPLLGVRLGRRGFLAQVPPLRGRGGPEEDGGGGAGGGEEDGAGHQRGGGRGSRTP